MCLDLKPVPVRDGIALPGDDLAQRCLTAQRAARCEEERGAAFRGALCSACVAAGLASAARLPREVALHDGAPFLVSYSLMAIVLALPLVFLELALGKLTEQGAVKLWRAIPLLKGLGYMKLFASFLVAVYYMVYLGIVCALLIWTAKGPVPLAECRELHRATDGYQVLGTPGEKCLNETFLKPVVDDPMWYGIVAAIIFTLWLLVSLCLIRIPQTFLVSLYIFGSSVLVLSLAIALLDDMRPIKKFFTDVKWERLTSMDLWCAACVQLFFSAHLGLGYHVTTGSTVYQKSCIFRSALWFVMWNIISGWLSVLLWYSIGDPKKSKDTSILMTLIIVYDSSLTKGMSSIKSSLAYSLLICSSLISVLSLIYPVIWCISLEDYYHKRSVGWMVSITGIFCSLSIFVLGLDVITILDLYVIPIYLMSFMAIKLFGLFYIYGCKSIKQDLDFILNYRISCCVVFLWMTIPLFLSCMIVWQIYKIFASWNHKYWTFWLTMGMFAFAVSFLLIWAFWVTLHKEGYGFIQKLIAASKPSRKWGPVEFKIRYKWLQYKSSKKKINMCTNDISENLCSRTQSPNGKHAFADVDKSSIQKILWVTEYEGKAKIAKAPAPADNFDPKLSCLVRHVKKCKCNRHSNHVCWKESNF